MDAHCRGQCATPENIVFDTVYTRMAGILSVALLAVYLIGSRNVSPTDAKHRGTRISHSYVYIRTLRLSAPRQRISSHLGAISNDESYAILIQVPVRPPWVYIYIYGSVTYLKQMKEKRKIIFLFVLFSFPCTSVYIILLHLFPVFPL